MRRQALLLLAVSFAGCMSMNNDGSPWADKQASPGCQGNYGRSCGPARLQSLQDGWGQGVQVQGPWAASPPGNSFEERSMLKNNIDVSQLDYYDERKIQAMNTMLAQNAPKGGNMPVRPYPQGGLIAPSGMPVGPGLPAGPVVQAGYNPAQPSQQPGYNSGYGSYGYPSGYGFGYNYNPFYGYYNPYAGYRASNGEVIHAEIRADGSTDSGIRQAQYTPPMGAGGYPGGGYGGGFAGGYPPNCGPGYGFGGMSGYQPGAGCTQRTQIKFTRPVGMKVYWYGMGPDGRPMYSPYPLETPGRYNFLQGATYRLKINNIDDRPTVELYPTLEVFFANAKTQDFLSHSAVPLGFSDDDFNQVNQGNYLVKVIYLPFPEYQDQAGAGIEELISTRLDPGTDPVVEARKRGTILLVIRVGNVDQGLTHTPPLGAGSSSASMPGGLSCPPGAAGCPPGGAGCPPGGMGYPPGVYGMPPGGPGCPPGGCPPGGAGYPYCPIPPSFSLGGADPPYFVCNRPLPQLPYMQGPCSPYANAPYCCPPYGPCGVPLPYAQQWCPPQYQQPCPPWMGPNPGYNPGALPPGMIPGAERQPGGMSSEQPRKFQLDGAAKEQGGRDFSRELPPPFPSDDKNAEAPPSPPAPAANNPPSPPPAPPEAATSSSNFLNPPNIDVKGPPPVPLSGPPMAPGDPAKAPGPLPPSPPGELPRVPGPLQVPGDPLKIPGSTPPFGTVPVPPSSNPGGVSDLMAPPALPSSNLNPPAGTQTAPPMPPVSGPGALGAPLSPPPSLNVPTTTPPAPAAFGGQTPPAPPNPEPALPPPSGPPTSSSTVPPLPAPFGGQPVPTPAGPPTAVTITPPSTEVPRDWPPAPMSQPEIPARPVPPPSVGSGGVTLQPDLANIPTPSLQPSITRAPPAFPSQASPPASEVGNVPVIPVGNGPVQSMNVPVTPLPPPAGPPPPVAPSPLPPLPPPSN